MQLLSITPVAQTPCQKHLGLYLDEKLNASHYIKQKIAKVCKGNDVIRKLYRVLPRHSLLTIQKSFPINSKLKSMNSNL